MDWGTVRERERIQRGGGGGGILVLEQNPHFSKNLHTNNISVLIFTYLFFELLHFVLFQNRVLSYTSYTFFHVVCFPFTESYDY